MIRLPGLLGLGIENSLNEGACRVAHKTNTGATAMQAIVWCNQLVTLLADLLLEVPVIAEAEAEATGPPPHAASHGQIQAAAVHNLISGRLRLHHPPDHSASVCFGSHRSRQL